MSKCVQILCIFVQIIHKTHTLSHTRILFKGPILLCRKHTSQCGGLTSLN